VLPAFSLLHRCNLEALLAAHVLPANLGAQRAARVLMGGLGPTNAASTSVHSGAELRALRLGRLLDLSVRPQKLLLLSRNVGIVLRCFLTELSLRDACR